MAIDHAEASMKVMVIGGGVGGLCLAQGLHQTGIETAVYERQASAAQKLAGYGIHIDAHGAKALQACLPAANWNQFLLASTSAGTELAFRDTQLRMLAKRDDRSLDGLAPEESGRRGIGRQELRDILLHGLVGGDRPRVHWGKTFSRYEPLADGRVRALFLDGTSCVGDLLVGADASNSVVRRQYLPHLRREELGILTIAGRYVLDEERARRLPGPLTDGSLNNIVPAGKGWMCVSAWHSRPADIGGEHRPAEHYVVWAYVVPRAETPGHAAELDPETLRQIALRGTRGWSPALATLIREADPATIAPVVLRSMPPLTPWAPGNVTLLGDAIHNMTPMAGIGANTALRDAGVLREVLAQAMREERTLTDAIGDYERRMRHYANAAVALSRKNAERAAAGRPIPRRMFQMLLRLAQACPPVMRATLGRPTGHES